MTPDSNPLHQLAWLSARSAGLVAWALAALATLLGLAMATRRVQSGPDARRLHQHLTLAGLAALAAHGVAIALDPWLKGGVAGVLVPFTIGYRPLAVAVGILTGWLMVAFAASWYLRRRIGARTWRYAHRFTPIVFVLATVHALTAGSDAGTWWMTLLAFLLCSVAAALVAQRWLAPPRPRVVTRPTPVVAEPEPSSLWAGSERLNCEQTAVRCAFDRRRRRGWHEKGALRGTRSHHPRRCANSNARL